MYRTNYPDTPGMHNIPKPKPTSFIQEVKESAKGILVGIILLIGSSYLLFWNEGRAVQTAKSLDEGLQSVRILNNIDVAFEEHTSKLIYVKGYLSTSQELSDLDYGISINAVKLRKKVEMFQWVEHESSSTVNKDDHESTEKTYSYSTEWKNELINSNLFNNPVAYQNPKSFPAENRIIEADLVRVGTFILSKDLKDKITEFTRFSGSDRPTNPNIKLDTGLYYHSQDVWNPQVGDIRVEFSYAGRTGQHPEQVSMIARQDGRELKPYQTFAGDQICLLTMGEKTAEEMFSAEHTQNTLKTWALRGGGWLIMFVAFSCITDILNTLVSRFPIVRDLVNLGVTSLNVSLSVTLSLIIIALGWIIYRPLLGVFLLFLSALPFLTSAIKLYRRDLQENKYRKL